MRGHCVTPPSLSSFPFSLRPHVARQLRSKAITRYFRSPSDKELNPRSPWAIFSAPQRQPITIRFRCHVNFDLGDNHSASPHSVTWCSPFLNADHHSTRLVFLLVSAPASPHADSVVAGYRCQKEGQATLLDDRCDLFNIEVREFLCSFGKWYTFGQLWTTDSACNYSKSRCSILRMMSGTRATKSGFGREVQQKVGE